MESRLRILPAADRTPSPWKNGGGITTEIAAFPEGADLDSFGWRISMAQVARGGPFSRFPGIDRILTVIEGRMLLEIAGHGAADLAAKGCVRFPGDVATDAEILDGPVADLNVMTRRGAFTAHTEWLTSNGTVAIPSGKITILAFPLYGAALEHAGRQISLAAGDAVQIESTGDEAVSIAAGVEFYRIELSQVR